MVQLIGIFSYLVLLLRAATLCFQSLAVGGILFLLLVTRSEELRTEELLQSAWKVIRWSGLGLAIAQVLFVVSNSMVLTYSAEISLRDVLGANYGFAGLLGVAAGVANAYWPREMRRSVSPVVLVPA